MEIKRKLILSVILLLQTFFTANAQLLLDKEFAEYKLLPNSEDTLIINRKQTDWWFGLFAGADPALYFGNLQIPRNIDLPPNDTINKLLNHSGLFGSGYFVGLIVDWQPPLDNWGVSTKLTFLDYRYVSSKTTPLADDPSELHYLSYINSYYLTISPSAKYQYNDLFHFFGGLDLELLTKSSAEYRKKFRDTARTWIEEIQKFPAKPTNLRVGLHIGAGLDMFSASINNQIRAYFTPFISFHFGTNFFNAWGSSRNLISTKIGLALRFSIDKIRIDTLYFDKSYEPPPIYLASARYQRGINISAPAYIAQSIGALYYQPQIVEELALESPSIIVEETQTQLEPKQPQTQQIRITRNYRGVLDGFPTSESAELLPEHKAILNAIAEYMKRNPNLRLEIRGHSDDQGGTLAINEARAMQRATAVVNYLMQQGIPRQRLLDFGDGARNPVASNRTEEGQRKNRRVEISFR